MGFELPNGKTARNLQDQVKFLSEKLKDLYAAFNDSGLKKILIVEELPEVGDPTVLYLLAKEDPEEGDYYDEYLWYDNQWEQIGTTQIDLSDYCTLSTDQTITGAKKFIDKIDIESETSDTYLNLKNSYTTTYIRLDGYNVQVDSTMATKNVVPLSNNNYDLGTSSYAWKDLYLSGGVNFKSPSNNYTANIFSDDNGRLYFVHRGTQFLSIIQDTIYAKDLLCWADGSYNLGSTTNGWASLHLKSSSATENWTLIPTQYNGLEFKFNNGNSSAFLIEPSVAYARGNFRTTSSTGDLGSSGYKWRDLYLSGKISDGNNSNYGLVLPNTTSWSDNKTISTVVIKQHSVSCSNGTLTILTNYAQSTTSGSTVSAACSVALSLKWNGYPAIYCSGTVVHYYDYADLTIKSASLGTINSDTITDY